MKRLALALAIIATPAHADAFRDRELAFQTLNAADAAETCYGVGSGRGTELNPILGSHPSCGKVVGFKAGFGLLHYAISRWLNDRNPHAAKVFQIVSVAVQGGVVAANLRVVF